jgi:hypothetical protein
MKPDLEGTWELQSGQPIPAGARDLKILSGGHFMFAAYDKQSGKPLYAAGGTYEVSGDSYVEHMEFGTDKLSDLVGKDQSFTIEVDGDMLTQEGTLSNGEPLKETFRRVG